MCDLPEDMRNRKCPRMSNPKMCNAKMSNQVVITTCSYHEDLLRMLNQISKATMCLIAEIFNTLPSYTTTKLKLLITKINFSAFTHTITKLKFNVVLKC